MIGTSRISGGGTNSLIAFFDQFFIAQIFLRSITPIFGPYFFVKIFGKSLSKPVRQGFDHNRIIIIMVFLKLFCQLLSSKTGGHTKTSYMILNFRLLWSNIIGKGKIWFSLVFFSLLSQGSEKHGFFFGIILIPDFDIIIIYRVCRK